MSISDNMSTSKCGGCKNSVVKNGSKCKICAKLYHRSCAQKVKKCCDEEITFSINVTKPGENQLPDSENFDSISVITEDSSNHELLLRIIQGLEDKNRLLEENTSLLKYKISVLENELDMKEKKVCDRCEKSFNIRNKGIIKSTTDDFDKQTRNVLNLGNSTWRTVTDDPVPSTSGNNPKNGELITKRPQATVNIDIGNKNKTSTNLNISGDEMTSENDDSKWKTVSSRNPKKKNRPALVIGNSSEPSAVQGIERLRAFHVSRLKPSTKAEDLCEFLKKNFTDVKCEPLQSRYPETYASFKVLIRADEFQKVQDASNWPTNACVNYFFHRGKGKNRDAMTN